MRRRCWAATTPGVQCTQWSQKAVGPWSHKVRGAARVAGCLGVPRIIRPCPQARKTLGAHDGVRRGAWRSTPRSRAVYETLVVRLARGVDLWYQSLS
jgi:hypothetical protein